MIRLYQLLIEATIPKIWYHGSYVGDITKFNTRRTKDKMGTYFSSDKEVAEQMRGGMNYIYTVEIRPKKVLDLSKYKDNTKVVSEFLDELPISEEEKRHYIMISPPFLSAYQALEYFDHKENLIPKLKRKGYDGIVFFERGAKTLVVFDPNIIKILKVEKT